MLFPTHALIWPNGEMNLGDKITAKIICIAEIKIKTGMHDIVILALIVITIFFRIIIITIVNFIFSSTVILSLPLQEKKKNEKKNDQKT